MYRPRFRNSQSPGNPDQEVVASQPDRGALLQEIDAGLATIAATLTDLEQESTQHRRRLESISGAARLFDEAGLSSEATAMHDGEQTIAATLSDNERRRAELTETAEKLLAAREQVAPSGFGVIAQLSAAAARREPARGVQDERYDNGTIAERAVQPGQQDTDRVVPPAAPDRRRSPTVLAPAVVAPDQATANAGLEGRPTLAAGDSSRGWKTPVLVGVVLLSLLAGGTFLAATMFGEQDDDSSSRLVVPAVVATDVQTTSGISNGDASATESAGAALIAPAPDSTEQPAVMMSPTAPSPPTAVTPQTTATTPPTSSIVPATQSTTTELGTVVGRVIDAESALRTGQIDASIEYPDGAQAVTRILFDLGASGETARLAISTTYRSGTQTRTTELVMLGAQAWERVDGSSWQEVSNVESGWGQVQVFLPRIATVSEPQRDSDEKPGELHWYDAGRNADIRLQVDPESGVPEHLHQVSRGSGSVLTVVYTSWNGPVQIDPPAID